MNNKKFWALETGDDPDDEEVWGPFSTAKEAIQKGSDYYLNRAPRAITLEKSQWPYDFIVSWSGQISSFYIIYSENKPDYFGYVRPALMASQKP